LFINMTLQSPESLTGEPSIRISKSTFTNMAFTETIDALTVTYMMETESDLSYLYDATETF
jgi:hypothetical protein